jgi:ParB-like chromosome segregation protein Spo0J
MNKISKIEYLPIWKIKNNPNNPRLVKDDKFKKLVKSIKDFPEMLDKRPIIVNEDMIVLGGNMRLKACNEAGLKEVPVIVANWTEEQQRAFIIKDNLGYGEWDWDMIADEWNYSDLKEWGLEIPGVNLDDEFNVADEYNYQNKVTIQFKTLEEATTYHEKCIKENLKAQLS